MRIAATLWFCANIIFSRWPKTEMGNYAAGLFGLKEAEIEVEASVSGIMNIIDEAETESYSGRFLSYKGGDYPW